MLGGSLVFLSVLDLRQNLIGSEGAKAIAHTILAGGFKKLTKLYVMQNQIYDQGLTALYKAFTCENVMCPLIECVNARDNPITPVVRKRMAPCPRFFQV